MKWALKIVPLMIWNECKKKSDSTIHSPAQYHYAITKKSAKEKLVPFIQQYFEMNACCPTWFIKWKHTRKCHFKKSRAIQPEFKPYISARLAKLKLPPLLAVGAPQAQARVPESRPPETDIDYITTFLKQKNVFDPFHLHRTWSCSELVSASWLLSPEQREQNVFSEQFMLHICHRRPLVLCHKNHTNHMCLSVSSEHIILYNRTYYLECLPWQFAQKLALCHILRRQ